MNFDRREFLIKMSVSAGMLSLPGIGFSDVLSETIGFNNHILHLGSVYGLDSNFPNSVSKLTAGKSLIFSTAAPGKTFQRNLSSIAPHGIHAVLFGGDWWGQIGLPEVDKAINENLPFINSNFTFSSFEKPVSVSKHLIINDGKSKIGVMGIGFGESGQKIKDTIEKMNQVSSFLKNELVCDKVYCLVDDPKPYFPLFSLRDLASSSINVNQFFGRDTLSKVNQLHVLRNINKDQVLVSASSEIDKMQELISFQKGRFSDYKFI